MPKKTKKKKNRRAKVKYPGLDKAVNARMRWEYMDQDYVDKLSPEEKRWLSNFNEEDLSGNFNHVGKKLYKTKKEQRECYARNNSRNRDIYSRAKGSGTLDYVSRPNVNKDSHAAGYETRQAIDHEDVLIDLIDLKKSIEES